MAIKNQQGQTLVEYILLLAVAVSLVLTFYNSEAFRRLFGSQGTFGVKLKNGSQFSYRHAYLPANPADIVDVEKNNKEGAIHPSYLDTKNSGTRFFGPKDPYE